MRQRNKPKRRSPRNVLRPPDLDHSKSSVLQSLGSLASERTYGFVIDDFIGWYCSSLRRLIVGGFGKCLAGKPSAAGSEGGTNCEFALPDCTTCREEARHVGAGDEQHRENSAQKNPRCDAYFLHLSVA
jgi:hypothetical protein